MKINVINRHFDAPKSLSIRLFGCKNGDVYGQCMGLAQGKSLQAFEGTCFCPGLYYTGNGCGSGNSV